MLEMFQYNFDKHEPISENSFTRRFLRKRVCTVKTNLTRNVLLHYLVKVEDIEMVVSRTAYTRRQLKYSNL